MMVSIFQPRKPGSRQSAKKPSWLQRAMMIFFRMFRGRYEPTMDLSEILGLRGREVGVLPQARCQKSGLVDW